MSGTSISRYTISSAPTAAPPAAAATSAGGGLLTSATTRTAIASTATTASTTSIAPNASQAFSGSRPTLITWPVPGTLTRPSSPNHGRNIATSSRAPPAPANSSPGPGRREAIARRL